MSESRYRIGFAIALLVCFALAGALAYVLWPSRRPAPAESSYVAAKGPDVSGAPAPASSGDSAVAPPLSPVQLSPQRLQAIGVTTAIVQMRNVSNVLRVPGNVDVNQRRLAYVQTRFPGWIQKVFANAAYQYVRKGEPLFTIYSQELVSTEQEYLLARQNQQAFADGGHDTAARERGWLLQAAGERLRQYGVPASELARLERTGAVERDITIDSPASGFITELNAIPNQYAQAETRLYTIADLSTVWVYANIFQNDIGQLRPGDPATVSVDAYPGRNFRGRIDQILPQVDPVTRTVRVRLVFNNRGLALKPGMFVNVNVSVPLGRQLVIPATGALQAGTQEIAFVDHGGGYLEPRQVELGPRLDDHVIVLRGLRAGERIVSSANFLVDSEAQLQAATGSFAPPPPGAGVAAAMNASPQQAELEFASQPSPPRRGSNTLRVTLSSADGMPIAGAEVSVTFFMPAMPAMGMAAVTERTTLADKGNGAYEGSLNLPGGGSYQVTISAVRDGHTLAAKQLTLNVTGGMQ